MDERSWFFGWIAVDVDEAFFDGCLETGTAGIWELGGEEGIEAEFWCLCLRERGKEKGDEIGVVICMEKLDGIYACDIP